MRSLYPVFPVATDLLAFVPAFWISGLARHEVGSYSIDWSQITTGGLVALVPFVIAAVGLGLYRDRYGVGTLDEATMLGVAWGFASVVGMVVNLTVFERRIPISVFGLGMSITGLTMLASRVVWRLVRRAERRPDPDGRTRVLVFGAGEGGAQVINSMMSDAGSRYVPVGLVDDDPRKRHRRIEGIPVVGTSDDIAAVAARADLLLIAIPSASAELIERGSNSARSAGLDVLILPPTTELFGMMATIESARRIEVTDLLGRDEVQINSDSVSEYLEDKVVLVSGAGGSIGSELCRRILVYAPRRLVMVDRDETALQGLQISMVGHGLLDDENLVLADIRDRDRAGEIFETYKPQIVFHAAALKHLPLLESHPREALLTNVVGTRNVLEAAAAVGVERFVNISTDKAADPTSVLGSTKRLAEALTIEVGQRSRGRYINVRFGNVVGSRGSVLPTFERQIARGGPVTVTDPDVTRFFMSIPEASQLVLQAGAIGETGETLVLDMGEPVRIHDLATKLIRHHGADVEIVFTGLRPNEKLHEVLQDHGTELKVGPHPRIGHARPAVSPVDLDGLLQIAPGDLAEALLAAAGGD